MRKDPIIAAVFILIIVGFWFYYSEIIAKQPAELAYYDSRIEEKKQRLLSAQILSNNLTGVSSLITENIADDPQDLLAQGSSLEFLRFLTKTIDKLGIKLVSMRTADPIDERIGYIKSPYEIEMLASYNSIGKFIAELEKSSRLISISSFTVNNHIGRGAGVDLEAKPNQRFVYISLEVLTMLRKGARIESN